MCDLVFQAQVVMIASNLSSSSDTSVFVGLAPLVLVVFLGFLAVGIPLAVLSLEVRDHLGFSTAVVGWTIGLQSIATVMTRHRAGTLSDHQGPRRAVLIGLPLASVSGLFYLLSAALPDRVAGKLGAIIAGRLTMGLAESLFITGVMTWGIVRLGASRTGKVMSWQGIAMYAALGLGAPLGLAIHASFGFAGVALATIIAPLMACGVVVTLPPVPGSSGQRVPFYRVMGLIWRPGLVLTLATMPFAVMAAFLVLNYAVHGWSGAGLALGGFGAGYILVRLVCSHLPDRFGGIMVAAGSLALEGLGQALIWLAPQPNIATLGATLTGVGFSLIFPSMGVVAMRAVPIAQRGRAVGGFTAFFDVALGVTGPVVGIGIGHYGIPTAFLVGTGATVLALILLSSMRLARRA